MSFLTPLFLLGGLAVAAPILFHLIRRTTRERIPFSSLMFLNPTPPRVTRRSRLEHIFLLLLRCAVLGLLALAFARPFLKTAMPTAPALTNGKHVLVLVDTSASMQRGDLWGQALHQIEETVESLSQPSDQVALFHFDNRFAPLITFEQWSATAQPDRIALVKERLKGIQPGWGATDLSAALLQGAELLEEAAGRAQTEGISSRKQIVLITDLQEGSRLSGLQGYEWPEGLDVTPRLVHADPPTNAGLQALAAGSEEASVQRVRVSNSTDSQNEQFQLSWAKGETPIGPVIQVYVPPGRGRVVQAPARPSGANALRIEGDTYPFDNIAFVGQASTINIPILYLGGETDTDVSHSLYYLKRAFLQSGRRQIQIVAGPAEQILNVPEASQAHLLIVSEIPSAAGMELLKKFLEKGRTILWVLESADSIQALSKLIGPVSGQEASVSDYAMWGRIDYQHPLFAAFADPRYSDFTKIHFWKYRRVDFSGIADAHEVVRFDLGDPAWTQLKSGGGNVHVLSSSWRPSDSQLGLSSKFVPLLYLLLDQSGVPSLEATSYTVGDSVPLERTDAESTWTVQRPDGSQSLFTNENRFANTDLLGLYRAMGGSHTQQFAINLAGEESRTAPLELERLEQLGVPLHSIVAENEKRAAERRSLLEATELENRQKLWRWLLVAAIVILIGESWLAGRLSRPSAEPTPIA